MPPRHPPPSSLKRSTAEDFEFVADGARELCERCYQQVERLVVFKFPAPEDLQLASLFAMRIRPLCRLYTYLKE